VKILSWNCQGVGTDLTVNYLKDLWRTHKPDILFLSETKRCFSYLQKFRSQFGFNNLYSVDPRGANGGLALFYNNDIKLEILYENNRIIDVKALLGKQVVFMSFIFGKPVASKRDIVWDEISQLGSNRKNP